MPCGCLQSKLSALAVVKALGTRLKKWDFFLFIYFFVELLGDCSLVPRLSRTLLEVTESWARPRNEAMVTVYWT